MDTSRRDFVRKSTLFAGASVIGSSFLFSSCKSETKAIEGVKETITPNKVEQLLKISLAQWSLNKAIFGGDLDHLDFASKAKSMGFDGIEYVNQFFPDKATDADYLKQMNARASDAGVKQLLIMIDREGALGALDDNDRDQAVDNHKKWVEAAKTLGCHSIRVNARGEGSAEEVASAAIDGLGNLASFAESYDINVIVENHGGYSSNGEWLANVMKQINMDNCGTLPDFGNFCITKGKDGCDEEYNKYQGVLEFMPYAKAVSAKSFDFDDNGDETTIDYEKMLKIVLDAGYNGYVGIEFEGSRMSPEEGILATKDLINKVLKNI